MNYKYATQVPQNHNYRMHVRTSNMVNLESQLTSKIKVHVHTVQGCNARQLVIL